MNFLKGYRTLIINVVGLISSLLIMYGIDVPEELQGHISTGILAVINIYLRFKTDTKVGQKSPSVNE